MSFLLKVVAIIWSISPRPRPDQVITRDWSWTREAEAILLQGLREQGAALLLEKTFLDRLLFVGIEMNSFLDYKLSLQILTGKKPTKVSIAVEKKDLVPQKRGLRHAYDGILNYPTTHPSVDAANGCSTPAHHPSPSPSLRCRLLHRWLLLRPNYYD